MKLHQLATGLLTLPIGLGLGNSVQAEEPASYHNLSPAALQQLETKLAAVNSAKKKSTAWMELGDPWMEWRAEQAKPTDGRERLVNPADIMSRFNQHHH